MKKHFGPTALLVLPLVSIGMHSAAASEVRRQDDAYHFVVDGAQAAVYTEWWYFNLFDQAQGLQLALTYGVLDPANLSGFGTASMAAIAYTPQGSFTQTESFPTAAFYASSQQADVVILGNSSGPVNYVQVIDDDIYRIVGSVHGQHEVSWRLIYVRQTDSWLAADREHVGVLPWEHMGWIQYMPGALVTGDVVIDGRPYRVANVRGYHDHNWGEWLPFTVAWNWAQYYEPGLAFSVGDFRNSESGMVSVDVAGRRTVFAKGEYQVIHTSWGYDPAHLQWVPGTTWVTAQNADTSLIVKMRALATEPVLPPPEIPLQLIPIVYEQTAEISGSVWQKNAEGEWTLSKVFRGGGFKEYTNFTLLR